MLIRKGAEANHRTPYYDAANYVQVFLATRRGHGNHHRPEEQFSASFTWTLPVAGSDSRALVHYAFRALDKISQSDLKYNKCGVIVSGLVPENARQLGLFEDRNPSAPGEPGAASPMGVFSEAKEPLRQIIDALNKQYGRDTMRLGATMSTAETQGWQMRQERLSPRYTTCFREIPVVHCG